MYYILYKTTNLVNGKFYVGKHKTSNLDDGYLGSGKLLQRAVRKHGFSNFQREVLEFCDSTQELNEAEKRFITEEMVSDPNCYNLTLGGDGGFNGLNRTHSKEHLASIATVESRRKGGNNSARGFAWATPEQLKEWASKGGASSSTKGQTRTEEVRRKMSLAHLGAKNSQHGSIWITDGIVNKKHRGGIPVGWRRGRT